MWQPLKESLHRLLQLLLLLQLVLGQQLEHLKVLSPRRPLVHPMVQPPSTPQAQLEVQSRVQPQVQPAQRPQVQPL